MPLLSQARKYRKPQPKESLKNCKKRCKEYRESVKEIKESIEKIIKETEVNEDDERIKPIPEKNKLEQITEELEIEGKVVD